ncbi:DUF5007 domain-containing protein [Sphingobacterium endophyticum]|uniref:DUF5007 domain-containing protein n=1 Tax=Sphingobacterium endophyticum TaxID=2546448 RepID=UPI0012E2E80D|nr:DUF5007 domain-containing protein [Sphingobacterium endophyticum]
MKISNNIRLLCVILSSYSLFSACSDMYGLPEDRDFISDKIDYTNKILEPILGRTTVFTSMVEDNSTLPMKFEIVNARYGDGRPVTDIFTKAPTYEWIQEYDGLEKSIAEIEAKRKLVEKPIFEVDSNGRLILWASANNKNLKPRPVDTVLKTQDIRFFDIKVQNSGGTQIIKDFQLIPWTQRDYYPDTDINPYTGGKAPDPQRPKDTTRQDYIIPSSLTNVIGERTQLPLANNSIKKDVVVYIRPFSGGKGNSLRIKFLGADGKFINPVKFNQTKWDLLVHGFNKVMNPEYVQYDVAYPIPLSNIKTDYSNGGTAFFTINYSRIGFGGIRQVGQLSLNYRIYKKGDWEIVFHFRNENPKFEDD